VIESDTATKIMKKAIDFCIKNGENKSVWGGTIPSDINDPNSPNDFKRDMVELPPGFTMVLTNPIARWTNLSDHAIFITLRETEDHLMKKNPGNIIKYSKLYSRWLNEYGFFNYTYGERLFAYPYNLDQISGQKRKIDLEFNQIERVIKLLKENPSSRKVCVSTWYPPVDLGNNYCPCNALFQFRIVDDKLDLIVTTRSLDILRGFSENIFEFTIFQEYVSNRLEVPLGKYITVALNAHLYKNMIDAGYHNETVPDPYDTFTPKPAFETPFPSEEFKKIDSLLFSEYYNDALVHAQKLSEYWKNWKIALITDYARLKKRFDIVEQYLPLITNEFRYPIERRLK